MSESPFANRPQKKLLLFDVDGTLTPARRVCYLFKLRIRSLMVLQDASPEMIELLRELRKEFVIGFVGGSDLKKIQEQLGVTGNNG